MSDSQPTQPTQQPQTTTAPSMRSAVLALLQSVRQEEQNWLAGLSDADRSAVGTAASWSPKDMLAHMAAWRLRHAEKLAQAMRGETPPQWTDMNLVNQINAGQYAADSSRSWPEAETLAEQAYLTLLTQVESMSDAELSEPQRYPWQRNEPLWGETLGNGVWHPVTHLTEFYRDHGDIARAAAIHTRLIERMRAVGLPDSDLGNSNYNLACLYALAEQSAPAIAALGEALRLNPDLTKWSRNDSDLASLHAEQGYQALYAGVEEEDTTKILINRDDLRQLQNERQGDQASDLAGDLDDAAPLVIDVREPEEYAKGHVAGARNIPLDQLEEHVSELSAVAAANRAIITYCNMYHPGASRGERASALLRERGVPARTLDGGFPQWKRAGLPTAKGQ
ncbi:MAG: rhodanese-like domain-containing protein [Ktedonobacterales bacterium]